jgi:S-adenosylmethionine decarboxylase
MGHRRWRGPQVNTLVSTTGTHLLADFHGVATELLRDAKTLERLLRGAAHYAGARVLSSHFHSFGEQDGVTGVVLLSESHISIHTWPESGFAAIDVFMCGSAQPQRAIAELTRFLAPQRQFVKAAARGFLEQA